ncbi:MAG: ABC transporter substrate-binding protein [Actinomycetota bacterium]|nr:ABC transporter substrate-binding protein [Actinomycetota bacterium]
MTYAGVESSGSLNSLDPTIQGSSQISIEVDAAYNKLYYAEPPSWTPVAALATGATHNTSGTVWTVDLRHGVHFHDGHEMTSADVVYTFRHLLNPKYGSDEAGTLSMINPAKVVATGRYSVQFTLNQPVGDFPQYLADKDAFIIANNATEHQLKYEGDGTGPFVPVSFQPTAPTHKFVRFSGYWQRGLPKAPCLVLSVIQNPTTQAAAMESGQIDVLQAADYSIVRALKADPKLVLDASGPGTSRTLPMWVDTTPFNNNDVREALKLVIDRQQMVNTVLFGYGTVGDDNPVPPQSSSAWRHNVPAQNIPEAKRLLKQAGYGPSHPLTVTLYTADMLPGAVEIAELYKQMAAEAGIVVNLAVGPSATYWSNVWLKQPFEMSGWNLRPPALALAAAYTGSNSSSNESHWHNAAYDKLLAEAIATTSQSKATALFMKAEKMLSLDGGEITPVFTEQVAVMQKSCGGYTPNAVLADVNWTEISCS